MSRGARLLGALLPLALPSAAHACAVCGGGNPANRLAFFVSTIALSLLPLGMFAAGVLWLRARLGDRLRDELQERDSAPITTAPPAVPLTPATETI